MGQFYSDVNLQPIENKALSRGIIHKAACILTEITIRKSQPISTGGCTWLGRASRGTQTSSSLPWDKVRLGGNADAGRCQINGYVGVTYSCTRGHCRPHMQEPTRGYCNHLWSSFLKLARPDVVSDRQPMHIKKPRNHTLRNLLVQILPDEIIFPC